MIKRRQFIQSAFLASVGINASGPMAAKRSPFGPLKADPRKILDLPNGFNYTVISEQGRMMNDGLLTPAQADGMAAFQNKNGNINLVCNHENHPASFKNSAFGVDNQYLEKLNSELIYDLGEKVTPGTGGTTTIEYNPVTRKTIRQHMSLIGTEYNCAGGPTPWGSWLSCEECFKAPGTTFERETVVKREKRHGYIFEVQALNPKVSIPIPIKDMGRFEHEAAAVDPFSGIIYLTEDKHRSLLYRFIPNKKNQLSLGGKLQALSFANKPSFDTRNWFDDSIKEGAWHEVKWIDLENVDPDENDLRLRGFDKGAARFARGEGICYAENSVFMTATIGGTERMGQVFEYRINREFSKNSRGAAGHIKLLAESNNESLLQHADNIIMSPWNDLIICEDTYNYCGLVGIEPNGSQYIFADNTYTDSELCGVCFSQNNSVMFVNIQDRGLTLAIHGPWPNNQ
tara:strand:+ start:2892 stop:4262 length:1371 start_codon:yes stop_codon:yes gene_type:complete